MIDWSKQPFGTHSKPTTDPLEQIEIKWCKMPWWKKIWFGVTQKDWKEQRLFERYRAAIRLRNDGK